MMPLLVAVLTLALAALGAVTPTAVGGLRQGRQAVWEAVVDAAAASGLADAELGVWVSGAAVVPVGGTLGLPPFLPTRGPPVVREARRIGSDLWLLVAAAEAVSPAGGVLARSEQGLLVRLVAGPGVQVVARPWFRRPG